jgi:hypothetical protein
VNASVRETASRPLNRICGLIAVLDAEYPTPMFPVLSMAIEPIHRNVRSGANVPCWNTFGALPAFIRNSSRRIPDTPRAVTA